MKCTLKEKVKIISLIFAEIFSIFKPHMARTATLHISWGLRLLFPGTVLHVTVICSYFKCVCPSVVELEVKEEDAGR